MRNKLEAWHEKPHIQTVDKWWDEVFLFLWGSIGMQIVSLIVSLSLQKVLWSDSQKNMALNFLTYSIVLVVYIVYLFIIRRPLGLKILESFNFKKKNNFKHAIIGWLMIIGANLISSLYLFVINMSVYGGKMNTSSNQSALTSISGFVIPFVITVVFYGPICEELAYRVGLCSLLERWNGIAAVLLTGFIFGSIHFDYSSILTAVKGDATQLISELYNIPTYIIAGWGLSLAYTKYGTYSSSFMGHFMNNLVAVIEIYA